MADISFWKERVKQYGHTGWCYPCTYGFDQALRMKVVEKLIGQFSAETNVLLDFGCGTGDFSWALKDKFQELVLYDPCAEVLEKARAKEYGEKALLTSEYNDLKNPSKHWDVVLSITVLQHIMSDEELLDVLDCLYKGMAPNGIFVVLETVFDNDEILEMTYERKWTYNTLSRYMEHAGFSLVSGYNFYSPSEENNLFSQYFNLPETIALRKDKSISDDEKIRAYKKLAEKYISSPDDFLSPLTACSGSKFQVYTKSIG